MHTDAQAPHKIFNLPQQFLVPLFQRRYRWGEERQWEPLWRDVQRVSDRLLGSSQERVNPHFLGAVVLQNVENPTGSLQEKIIIDGQQRFTTLQLLMDAVHGEFLKVGARQAAARLGTLIENGEQFRESPEEQFKIRPTHEDRPQFDRVMAAEHPVDYAAIKKSLIPPGTKGTPELRMIDAHEFFAARCREWLLLEGDQEAIRRADTLDKVLRDYLEIVVIDLSVDENSQEIFETLNSRGVELTAADLIKNFVFQKLRQDHPEASIESLYNEYWRDFDRLAFWDEEEALGRTVQKRSSAFLGYWLTSQTGEETVLSEVFYRFKNLVLYDLDIPMLEMLHRIKQSAQIYRSLVDASMRKDGDLTRVELFMYRIKALDSNIAKAVPLTLLDEKSGISEVEMNRTLDLVESWIVRRAILQKSVKRYNFIIADIVRVIRTARPDSVADAVEKFLSGQSADSSYWPDDEEISAELHSRNMYHRRPRGRMILEAIEDHYRGWGNSGTSKSQTPRAMRMVYSVEHILPQQWEKYWPLAEGVSPQERTRRINVIGNLTLVTKALNSSLSNDMWVNKKETLFQRDIGFMNKRLVSENPTTWSEGDIDKRTSELEKVILGLWPVPAGHKVANAAGRSAKVKREVLVSHLLEAGLVKVGQILYPNRGKYAGRNGVILEDGTIEIEGSLFESPSGAGRYLTGRSTAGWSFWIVNQESRQALRDIRQQYIEGLSEDVEVLDDEDEDEVNEMNDADGESD